MTYFPLSTDCITNSSVYSLINSVDFHPAENLFCATFSGRDLLALYTIDGAGRARLFQKIAGPTSLLKSPQHAVFSRDGSRIIVSNWTSETFSVYARSMDGVFSLNPARVIPFPALLSGYKPHGSAINSTGNIIAVAFGASERQPKAIATFGYDMGSDHLQHLGLVEESRLPGIPKGICFSPDDSHLIVTFSDVNCIGLYEVNTKTGAINASEKQIFRGSDTALERPEDIKITHQKDQVIVSNSGSNSIAFYKFDMHTNRIVQEEPVFTLGAQQRGLAFPHGLAVSPDGSYLVVSQFGKLQTTSEEDIIFGRQTPTRQSKIWIFERSSYECPPHRPWTPLLRQWRDRAEGRS